MAPPGGSMPLVPSQSFPEDGIASRRADLCCDLDEDLDSSFPVGRDLPLADHVSRLDPGDRGRGRVKGLEPHHRAGDPLDEAVILLDDVVQVFDLPDFHGATTAGEFQDRVHRLKPGQIGTTLVYDDALGHAIGAYRPPEEVPRGDQIAPLGEREVKSLAVTIDSAVEIGPTAFTLM